MSDRRMDPVEWWSVVVGVIFLMLFLWMIASL